MSGYSYRRPPVDNSFTYFVLAMVIIFIVCSLGAIFFPKEKDNEMSLTPTDLGDCHFIELSDSKQMVCWVEGLEMPDALGLYGITSKVIFLRKNSDPYTILHECTHRNLFHYVDSDLKNPDIQHRFIEDNQACEQKIYQIQVDEHQK